MDPDVTISSIPPHPDDGRSGSPDGALIDPGPRPYTLTDMIVGIIVIALLEYVLGWQIAQSSSSAAWGIAVSFGTFLILISFLGFRFRARVGRWLTAHKLARTNMEIAWLDRDAVPPVELCSSMLTIRRCTTEDASPLRRQDIDRLVGLTTGALPRLWVLAQEQGPIDALSHAPERTDASGRRITPCRVVRESLGRSSSTVSLLRLAFIIALTFTMVTIVVSSGVSPCGCVPAFLLFVIIAGLLPAQRVALADRLLAANEQGLWLVLTPAAEKKREAILEKRAARLNVRPEDLDDTDPVVRHLPSAEVVIPWRSCYAVLTRPRVGTGWRWRFYPPRDYWSTLGIGGPFVIEADGLSPEHVPWRSARRLLRTSEGAQG